jgi:hypothetical protein
MKKIVSILLVSVGVLFVCDAQAAVSPVSLSLLPPLQFPPSDFTVVGFRASLLWGKQRDIYGLDLGLLGNITEQTFTGIGIAGGANITHGTTTIIGLQLAGIANINTNKTSVYGVQAALVNSNTAAASVGGIELGVVNLAQNTNIYGLQAGIYNRALEVYGFQIGLVNVASSLHGIQIGLLNFHEKGAVSVSPIINIGF